MPQSQNVRKLKKNKAMADYLRELKTHGRLPRRRVNTHAAARRLGLVQDIVQMPTGALVSEYAALCYYGSDWYKHTKSTTYECITVQGLQALQELDNSG